MINKSKLQHRDARVLWHPCSQMKDYETFWPLEVERAEGCYIYSPDGRKVIDAISSWWCKSLGHGHPRLKAAIRRQLDRFEHVILANTTNENIVQLSERLTALTRGHNKAFYASEGSSAMEIAIKMSIHSRLIRGQPERCEVMGLKHGYHGETLLALAVSDVGLYRDPYKKFLPKAHFIQTIPYVFSTNCQGWDDCSTWWIKIEKQLANFKNNLTAIVVEPIVQATGGMLIYSQDFLSRLRRWCDENDVHLIADEIMTGLGRTGKMFACEHAGIEPDFLCIGKGLTAGFLPMSAVLMTDTIYQTFYQNYEDGHSFLHSHTHSGNALAAAVANEVLEILIEDGICDQVSALEPLLSRYMHDVSEATRKIKNIRFLGGIVAADLEVKEGQERAGYRVYQQAVAKGALLRPLGNTIYWLPPFTIKQNELQTLRDITIDAITEVLG